MSVAPDEKEFVELPNHGDSAFGALLDALVPAEAGATGAGEGDPAGQSGSNAEGATGTPSSNTDAAAAGAPVGDGAPNGGGTDTDGQAQSGSPDAAGTGAGTPAGDPAGADATGVPAAWTVEPATVLPTLGELTTKFEENVSKAYKKEAYDAAREEYGQYFEALEKHPRLLVGTTVSAIGK